MSSGTRFSPTLDDDVAPLVLHVTEAMGGGLEDAVHDFIRSTPEYRHALLFTRRGDFATEEHQPAGLVDVVDAGRGVRALRRAYGPTVRRLQPQVVHLHSAWAGLVGRAARLRSDGASVVYTPHSYFFDRRDAAPPVRLLARAVERVLVRRTDLVAAISPAEAAAAKTMGARSTYIPNVARLSDDRRWSPAVSSARPEVLLVGRVTAQKDPEFLLEVRRLCRTLVPTTRWTWIGAGDHRMEARLRAAGVDVTGWLPRAECLDRMRSADVYLHTAAWEGSPITLLEAAAFGMPIVARSIPALDSLGFDPMLRTPRAVAMALVDVLQGSDAPKSPPPAGPEDQARALVDAYTSVGAAGPVRVPVPTQIRRRQRVPVELR